MKATLIALTFAIGVASPVLAANARHPYQNVDRRVDAGNPTGDDVTARLNQQQLNTIQNGGAFGSPSMPGQPMGGSGMPQ